MRRFALSSRLIGSALPVLAAGVLSTVMAVGDVTISVVDATPTAFQDESLDGIGQTIHSAEVYVEVSDGDAWRDGGVIGNVLVPGARCQAPLLCEQCVAAL